MSRKLPIDEYSSLTERNIASLVFSSDSETNQRIIDTLLDSKFDLRTYEDLEKHIRAGNRFKDILSFDDDIDLVRRLIAKVNELFNGADFETEFKVLGEDPAFQRHGSNSYSIITPDHTLLDKLDEVTAGVPDALKHVAESQFKKGAVVINP